jgi:hypothetical protein
MNLYSPMVLILDSCVKRTGVVGLTQLALLGGIYDYAKLIAKEKLINE